MIPDDKGSQHFYGVLDSMVAAMSLFVFSLAVGIAAKTSWLAFPVILIAFAAIAALAVFNEGKHIAADRRREVNNHFLSIPINAVRGPSSYLKAFWGMMVFWAGAGLLAIFFAP